MGSLRILSAQEVCHILEQHGFVVMRQRGSHIIMQRLTESTAITVVVPNYRGIRLGTLRSIIRQSGLPRYLFEVSQ